LLQTLSHWLQLIYIYIYVIRLFKDLTVRRIYVIRRLRVKQHNNSQVQHNNNKPNVYTRIMEHKTSESHLMKHKVLDSA